MEKTLYVAKSLYYMYNDKFGMGMDEMKMHKLMYFAQRESLMYNNKPLFNESFYGWKYGPVLKSVRSVYHVYHPPFKNVHGNVSSDTKLLLQNVLNRYGNLSSWKLSSLSHDEFSWKMSRKGLAPDEDGDNELSLMAMRIDAVREQSLRKMEK